MTAELVSLFSSAVASLPSSTSRSLELFTEITEFDETACDAWVGRIRCGDIDRVTLFRAWYTRVNLGQLAGAADLSLSALSARVPIGGLFGNITYPVNSPLSITLGFAVSEARAGNFSDAMEALDDLPSAGSEYLVAWAKAVIFACAQRWTDVIEELRSSAGWPDEFLAGAAEVAKGVAAAGLGLFTEAERRLTEANASPAGEACAPAIAWYLALARRAHGNEESAVALLEWLQATHPEPKVSAALADPGYRLVTTSAERIASRSNIWDPESEQSDEVGRENLLAVAQAELDRQIGLDHVKQQVDRYRAATQMAKVRASRGMKVSQTSKHMIFAGPPGTGKTTVARVVANILAGLGVIAEPKLIEASRKDFVAEYEGQSAAKTARTIDRALNGVLFIDEAYTLVQERDGRADPFGSEALDLLLARMENDRDRLVVIIAGYRDDMDRLLEANDGLRSRFATRIEFGSYSPGEIREIAKVVAGEHDSALTPDAAEVVERAAMQLVDRTINGKPALDIAGNGRYARQLVEAAEELRDLRLAQGCDIERLERADLATITADDMSAAVSAVHSRLGIGG